jgi:hypothetical protein
MKKSSKLEFKKRSGARHISNLMNETGTFSTKNSEDVNIEIPQKSETPFDMHLRYRTGYSNFHSSVSPSSGGTVYKFRTSRVRNANASSTGFGGSRTTKKFIQSNPDGS